MRELAALRMVWASAGLDGGGDVVGRSDVVREEAAGGCGCAALAISRVVSGAGEARLTREEAEDGHERGCERAGGFGNEQGDAGAFGKGVGVLPVARGDEAGTGRAVVGGVVVPAAYLLEAKDELAELLLRASKGVDVALGGGWGAAVAFGAEA